VCVFVHTYARKFMDLMMSVLKRERIYVCMYVLVCRRVSIDINVCVSCVCVCLHVFSSLCAYACVFMCVVVVTCVDVCVRVFDGVRVRESLCGSASVFVLVAK
jgi:hypothetical protein